MTLAPSLVTQRLDLRDQLRTQRQEVAEQLFAAKARGRFPRSITVRVLMSQPELAARLLARLTGARFSGSVTALLVAMQVARAAGP